MCNLRQESTGGKTEGKRGKKKKKRIGSERVLSKWLIRILGMGMQAEMEGRGGDEKGKGEEIGREGKGKRERKGYYKNKRRMGEGRTGKGGKGKEGRMKKGNGMKKKNGTSRTEIKKRREGEELE